VIDLPLDKKKYLKETKPLGVNFRNTKIMSSEKRVLTQHRHWVINQITQGMNVPMGGHGRISLIEERISSNGEHGVNTYL
jgi:hypothetical protein